MSSTDAREVALWGLDAINIVDLVVSTLSLVGAILMIGACLYWRLMKRARHRLIFGLAVADFILAMTVITSTAISLHQRRPFKPNTAGCRANAFFYLTSVFAINLWTLAIAVITYIILVHPMSSSNRVIEHKTFFVGLWIFIYGISVTVSSVGIGLYPVNDVGGICFFSATGNLFSTLVLFIPRASILLVVIVLYLRLFVFFRRKSTLRVPVLLTEDTDHFEKRRRSSNILVRARDRIRKPSHTSDQAVWSDLANVKLDIKNANLSDRRGSDQTFGTTSRPSNDVSDNIPWSPHFQWSGSTLPRTEEPPASPRGGIHPIYFETSSNSTEILASTRRSSVPQPHTPSDPLAFSSMEEQQKQYLNSLKDSQSGEAVPEKPTLSAQDLNRRAAILMLLYPAAYVILFTASIARGVMDLADDDRDKGLQVLHAVSRWLIFASGIVDAIIFVIIEKFFQRTNRSAARRQSAAYSF